MEIGISHQVEKIIEYKDTAVAHGSGQLEVFATPAMIGMMEMAARDCVSPYLEKTQSTVGTKINIEHIAATAVGKKVYTKAFLKEIDGRKLLFDVEAFDENKKIGLGTHERFIIDIERFMEKIKQSESL